VRFPVQRLEPLDRAMERLADGIEVYLDSPASLPLIRDALAEAPPGRAQVRLIPWLGGREAEILLPQPLRPTAPLVARLRTIPGVRYPRGVGRAREWGAGSRFSSPSKLSYGLGISLYGRSVRDRLAG
jgi:hypothetical protein